MANPALRGEIASTVPAVVYHLVPIVVLIVTGFLLYSRPEQRPLLADAATVGIPVVPTYLLLSAAGVRYFKIGGVFTMSEPNPVPAIVLAGILYPLVWGAIGRILGYGLR